MFIVESKYSCWPLSTPLYYKLLTFDTFFLLHWICTHSQIHFHARSSKNTAKSHPLYFFSRIRQHPTHDFASECGSNHYAMQLFLINSLASDKTKTKETRTEILWRRNTECTWNLEADPLTLVVGTALLFQKSGPFNQLPTAQICSTIFKNIYIRKHAEDLKRLKLIEQSKMINVTLTFSP